MPKTSLNAANLAAVLTELLEAEADDAGDITVGAAVDTILRNANVLADMLTAAAKEG